MSEDEVSKVDIIELDGKLSKGSMRASGTLSSGKNLLLKLLGRL